MTNPNQHIEEFLKYYLENNTPEYAVLLKGAWGVGKTYFVKRLLESFEGKYLYVSLYGVSSYQEIEDEFFVQLHPVLGSKKMALAGKILKGVLKTKLGIDLDEDKKPDANISSQIPDIKISEYLSNIEGRFLIFDDLERCAIPINNILGYINSFVEHQEFKVIIIANEEEIHNKDEKYKTIKEKLIGKTFEIESDLDSAIIHFIDNVDTENPEIKNFYRSEIELIKQIHESSSYNNLRHLKQSLWDFEHFYRCLSEKVKGKKELIKELFTFYLCFFYEVRSGNILALELKDIFNAYVQYSVNQSLERTNSSKKVENNKEKSVYEKLKNRYSFLCFEQVLLECETWSNIMGKGLIEKEKIESSLLKSKYFDDGNTPVWLRLWHYRDLTDEQFDNYLEKMLSEFNDGIYEKIGILKHTVGLLLDLINNALCNEDKEKILRQAKYHVDSLKERNLIPAHLLEKDYWGNEILGNYAFFARELHEFKELEKYIEEKQEQVREEELKKIANELLELVKDNMQALRERVYSNFYPYYNLQYSIPIFSYIEVETFINSIKIISPENLNSLFEFFIYRHKTPINDLKAEIEWFKKIKDRLIIEQQKPQGKLSSYRLGRFIKELINIIDKSQSNSGE